jgi:hypothetical protein
MIDFQRLFDKLQKALGVKNPLTGKNCADEIDEKLWRQNVIPTLDEISIETAVELQKETGRFYPKDSVLMDSNHRIIGVKSLEELRNRIEKWDQDDLLLKNSNNDFVGIRKRQEYSEAPPTRLLSMTLNLCYWLGFIDASGDHELHKEGGIGAWDRIDKAYKSGFASHPKSMAN